MKIYNKLIYSFLLLASLILFSSLFGIWNITRVNNSLNYVTSKAWIAATSSMQISIDVLTEIMANDPHLARNKKEMLRLYKLTQDSLQKNFRYLYKTGLADKKVVNNIKNLYYKLDVLQKRTSQIYIKRNKTKLQLDENAILWTRALEKFKNKISYIKKNASENFQTISGIIIDISILSLSERSELNNYLSGFISGEEYLIQSEGVKSSIKRRIEELSSLSYLSPDELHPIQNIYRETDILLARAYDQHKLYTALQTELNFNTLRLVESMKLIRNSMNAKMSEAANQGTQIAHSSKYYFILFTLISLAASLVIGLIVSKIITKPITVLRAATEKISQGKLSQKVVISSKDEIGELGKSFNIMTDKLMNFTDEVRTKNEELENTNKKVSHTNKELHTALDELQIKTVRLNTLNNELQKVSRHKSEFLANMGHELRTPMTAIIGYTKLVLKQLDDTLSDKHKKNLHNVLLSSEHLLTLINDILDLSKIEAGKMQLNFTSFDLRDVINTVLTMVKPIADEKNLTLIPDIPAELPTMYSESDKIRQILLNLIGNSVKFTQEGNITISVKIVKMTLIDQTHTDFALIDVKDTGIGISENDHELIFEDFRQSDGSITRKYGGTGLGLSISRKLARMVGGDITVKSTLGEGSTFSIHFPIDYEVEENLKNKLIRQDKLSKGFKTLVLAIDDNKEFLLTINKMLTGEGFDVVDAINGVEAISKAKTLLPNIIITDIILPKKSGWDVIEELRNDPKTVHIPIIIITILDRDELEKHIGYSEYLQKPIGKNILISTINKHVSQIKKTVLVIDSNPALSKKITTDLTKEGFLILNTSDTHKALELLSTHKPDLVLFDPELENNNGDKFFTTYSQNTTYTKTPLIIFTKRNFTHDERVQLDRYAFKIIRKDDSSLRNISEELLVTLKALST
ncbi:MAG: ATP-binding protein [Candidatus Ancaeobacter aquaticus]|nr:ATP-binding protein [Candidatus Ancaeobacter aquaticus]